MVTYFCQGSTIFLERPHKFTIKAGQHLIAMFRKQYPMAYPSLGQDSMHGQKNVKGHMAICRGFWPVERTNQLEWTLFLVILKKWTTYMYLLKFWWLKFILQSLPDVITIKSLWLKDNYLPQCELWKSFFIFNIWCWRKVKLFTCSWFNRETVLFFVNTNSRDISFISCQKRCVALQVFGLAQIRRSNKHNHFS